MPSIDHTELKIGSRIVEGKKTIRVNSIERWPECMCRNSTHVNGDSCYTSTVRVK